ncbi:peptidylprolyl isomerase [Patescibacteria group bacterium]
MNKKITLFLLIITVLFFSGCTKKVQVNDIKPSSIPGNLDLPEMPDKSPVNLSGVDFGKNNKEEASMSAKKELEKPAMLIDNKKSYTAKLQTDEGEISIKLFADKTPITANNFVYLARNDFYNQTIFHRIMANFMIQGGDPKGDGTGGPGYRFADEPFEGEYKRGIVAMANAGPDTNGSQFFIMHKDYSLPPNYVIFGQVIKGIEVVDKIATAKTTLSPTGENSVPVNPVKVSSVTILEE